MQMHNELTDNYVLSIEEHVFRVFCQWIKHNYGIRMNGYNEIEYLERIVFNYDKEKMFVHLSRLGCVNRWAYKTLRQTYVGRYYSCLARVWRNVTNTSCYLYPNSSMISAFRERFGNLHEMIHPSYGTESIIKAINNLKEELKKNGWSCKENIVKAQGYADIQVMIIDPTYE